MNTQHLTPALIVEELIEWEAVIRDMWKHKLPVLDTVNIWRMPDCTISMYTLIFRAPNNNTHMHTDWFLIDPYQSLIEHHNRQYAMYMAVKPATGYVDMLWNRENTWYTMAAQTSYAFDIYKHHVTGRMMNRKETLT